MKKQFNLLMAALAVVTLAVPRSAEAKPKNRYVVVLSLDGFRWDYVQLAKTPTLDSLRTAGATAEVYPCFPSNTFPNHYSMATGLHPDHHGIVANTFYDRRSERWFTINNDQAVQNPEFWRGEPIWNTAERQGVRAATCMWVGCQTAIGGRQASVWKGYDGNVSCKQRADWVLGQLTKPVDSIPRLVMWYIEEPDYTAHEAGTRSQQTVQRVQQLDSLLAYFFREVRRSPVFADIDFIVTSDHGMADLSADRVVNLYGMLDQGRIRDVINSTPLYLDPEPAYTDEACRIINAQPHLKAFKRSEIPAQYHYGTDTMRIMPVVVLPEVGWTVVCREKPLPPIAANHGFDPAARDMHMIFYASGPDFKPGYAQEPFQNLNLHAIIAYLLGIEPAQPNDCDIKPMRKMFR